LTERLQVTYIHHSSFLVETASHTMLFDYFRGDIPPVRREKPLWIFASHAHSDHYVPGIFRLSGLAEEVHYVLSDDIPLSDVPADLQRRTSFLGAGFTAEGDGIRIRTYDSTDQGVAYLVESGGRVIYHAGDLNDWYWDGDEEDRANSRKYLAELKKIRETGLAIDCAFVPLDPRLGGNEYRGMKEFMENVGARHVFPMHFWGDFAVADRLKTSTASDGWRDRLIVLHREGEKFLL
jgi:L-ascorbate metabolism protein UlaG (beta-lactamase superfamily)